LAARILILTADPGSTDQIARLLSAHGYLPLVPGSVSGPGAPDLVLCMLPPGADATGLLAGLRAGAALNGAPVLALTSLAHQADSERLLAAGFDGYIALPIEPDSFAAEVAAFLPAPTDEVPTLLLVDDDAFMLKILADFLGHDGYRILAARSGAEALEVLAREPVQVILSDQWMPAMSGTEFMAQAHALYPQTVRLILSAQRESADIAHAIGQRIVDSFHAKPWSGVELRDGIRAAFELQRRRAGR
jgi:two-component system cell cycle response regulator